MGLGELNSGPALLSELDPAQEVHELLTVELISASML